MTRRDPARLRRYNDGGEAVWLGPTPCHDCGSIVFWGHSPSWTPKWGYGRVMCRDRGTGRKHRCAVPVKVAA